MLITLVDNGTALHNQTVRAEFFNGTVRLGEASARTNDVGQALIAFAPPADVATVRWVVAWHEDNGTPMAEVDGEVHFVDTLGAVASAVGELRADVDAVRLEGVHLDEMGSRDVFLTSVRAAGAVALAILLILLVIHVAIRM